MNESFKINPIFFLSELWLLKLYAYVLIMEECMGNGREAPHILNIEPIRGERSHLHIYRFMHDSFM
jgi:hypothetical protein